MPTYGQYQPYSFARLFYPTLDEPLSKIECPPMGTFATIGYCPPILPTHVQFCAVNQNIGSTLWILTQPMGKFQLRESAHIFYPTLDEPLITPASESL